MEENEEKGLANLFFETNILTRIKRSGNMLVNNPTQDNVSDHAFRTMFIAQILAKIEKVNVGKILQMCILKNLPKTRIQELHKVASHYINEEKASENVFKDQTNLFPKEMRSEIRSLYDELGEKQTKEATICRDASYLAEVLSTKESIERGVDMTDWIKNLRKAIKLNSSRKIMEAILESKSTDWWKNLKYIPEIERGLQK